MKHLLPTLALLLGAATLLAIPALAQGPAWQSATAIGGRGQAATVTASVPDGSGSVYVAGSFVGMVSFGATTLTSTNSGSYDGYVAKWNTATSSFAWVVQVASTGYDEVYGLAVSGGSVYVAGDFSGPAATVGGLTLSNANTSSTSKADVFAAKLVDAGSSATVAWATRAGGTGSESLYRLALSGTSLYLTGYYDSSPAVFGATSLPNAGGSDLFVAKLVDAGSSATWSWAVGAGGTGNDEAYGVAVSGSSVYIAGAEKSPTLTLGGTTLTGAGSYDGFVAKLTDAGSSASFAWAQRFGSASEDGLANLVASGSSIYAVGGYTGTLAAGSTTLASAGGYDVLLLKLTDAGSSATVAWAQRGGGPGDDIAYGLAERGGDLYLCGLFGDIGTTGSTTAATFGGTTLTSVGGSDAFVARVRDSGTSGIFNYAQQAGGPGDDIAYGTFLSANRLYVGGFFLGASATFGATTLTGSATGYLETGFLAYLNDPILATAAPAAPPAMALYPNPAHASATVRVPAGAGAATLTLLDALGRVVGIYAAPAGQEYPLGLAGLALGVYTLRIGAASQKLVVE